ncbi:MAG: FtsX-like permease family protein [Anaerolineae bacterium]|nr:FtsX-like permease family protein [Anaerolineae bacterium]
MLIKPRWRKVIRDLWLNKNRTIIVVLSIAVGVFAVGTIATSQIILSRDLSNTYLATNPASATLMTFDSFDQDVVDAVDGMREVAEAEARRRVTVRVKTGPDEWRQTWLVAIPDFDDIKIDKFEPESGAWPPPDHEILIERSALSLLDVKEGDVVLVKTAEGKEREMRIAGLAHDLNAQMYVFDGVGYGYITEDTLEWLDQPSDYNELRFVVADHRDDYDHIQEVTGRVRDKVEDSGAMVFVAFVPPPGKHLFLDPFIQAISIMMGALAVLSLLLSGFLVINTISALVAQQTRQIGMMKAVGARTPQIMSMYLITVAIFGLLALLIAVPAGMVGAYLFSRFIASFLNFDVTDLRLPTEVLLAQVGVGLLIPLIAALYPILAGVRVTVREAISEYGLGKGRFGTNRLDRLLLNVQNNRFLRRQLTRPLLLSLRNTFRRKTRLSLTLLTLILGGSIFITVFSLRVSMLDTLRGWLDYFRYDVAVQFERDYRIERIIRETLDVPGIVEAEPWAFYNTRRERPDGTESDSITLLAPPLDTTLINPTVIEGRWLAPEDSRAVVINSIIRRNEPDIQVGDKITLKIDGRDDDWTVVGVFTGGFPAPTIFTSYENFASVTHDVGRAEWVFATTEQHNLAYQTQVSRALEDRFEAIGFDVGLTTRVEEEIAEVEAIFEVIIVLLLIMAVLLAVIGGLGLMGTMSINVLERTREIGVMRAIGASDGSVQKIFIVEGIIIGLLSWIVGTALAYPLSRYLSQLIGQQFLSAPLDYTFSITGVLLWLGVVIILSALASFLPAWNASRMTVREVLAYE